MADELAKGLGILTGAGLGWMVLAGWYNTESFEGTQFLMPNPEPGTIYDMLAITVKDGLFWFAILGVLAFWVLIPLYYRARARFGEQAS